MDAPSRFHPVILCVDEEGAGIELRRRVLHKLGFSTLVATSAQQALEIFRENQTDLVLMEYIEPTITGGATLVANLKALKPQVPVAILTAAATAPPEDLLSADAFISKLVSIDELLQIIERLLLKSKAAGAP